MSTPDPNNERLIARINQLGDWHFKQAVILESLGRVDASRKATAHRRSLATCRQAARELENAQPR